jgi:hypothetical protein
VLVKADPARQWCEGNSPIIVRKVAPVYLGFHGRT